MPTRYTSCSLCEAICGLEVDVSRGPDGVERIDAIRGDKADAFSRGHICPKAVALKDIHEDPDRLRRPLRRRGSGWEEIGWGEALDEAAERLGAIRRARGKDAVGFYYGNPTGHDFGALLYGLLFQTVLGTRNLYSANSTDGLPRMLTSLWMYGNQAVIPVPDIDRTDFLLVLGGNPVVSNGSVMTAPDCRRRLKALRARGARLVVVDPRRTETAALADTHLFIRPGCDAFLLLAMLHVLQVDDPVIRDAAARCPPSLAAARTGIPEADIERLARDFAAAPSAVAYGRMGTCTQRYGALTTWLLDVLNIQTGNLDRPGGAMFSTPAFDLPAIAGALGQTGTFDTFQSRVSGYPEFNGELPVAALAEEITTPGPGQIRALVTHAGNPVLSAPGGQRLDAAFQTLEFMVSVDIYLNETTRHADLILPSTFGLEHDNYSLLFHALGVRNAAKWAPAVLAPAPDSRHSWEILLGLSRRMMGRPGRLVERLLGVGPAAALRLALRLGPHDLRLRDLQAAPHGVDLGPLEPRLPGILRTPDKRIQLAPPRALADLDRLLSAPAEEGLLLIGRRHLRSNNSWMHNSRRLTKGRPRCTLRLHPLDAAARGLASGDSARVSTAGGEVRAPVEVSDEMMPGVVSLPHGWGHDPEGTRQSVACARPGVNANALTIEGRIDPVSGASALNGVPCDVGL